MLENHDMSHQSLLCRRQFLSEVVGSGLRLGASAVATFLLPTVPQPARAATAADSQPARLPPAATRLPLVMLDPGHGGKDPGAIGLSGTYEKQVALASAHELKRLLEHTTRFRVELTRADDVFIPLAERVAHAQSRGAALFVSMHADAVHDHAVRGASVYTLARTASDAQTAALAERENSADRFARGAARTTNPAIAQILESLVRQETRAGSARFARGLVGQLSRDDISLLTNPARHADFIVLQAADIPSVLVEMGFMSNAEDEVALRRPEHRAHVADAIKRAVEAYFATKDGNVRIAS
jgi:N-acetylmuramoyl-L-alanine amidase